MGLLYEVYTLPWDSGGFKKKFFWLPVEPGSGTGTIEFLTSTGEGSVNVLLDKLEEAGRDLTEIVSDTTSSLIRVIDCLPDGTRTIIDEWVCERPARVHDDARKVTISGPKLKAKAFDSQAIPAFDSPANPSINPDHVWGGENILSDPGYENANIQNEEYEIDLDGATGGSFILHLNGNDTNSIPFDTSVANLENEVEALPGITDVLVDDTGAGYRIEFHNPISPENEGLGLLTWTPSLTGTDNNEESLERTNAGLILPSAAWTTNQYADATSEPKKHGTYASDGYRLTEGSEPVRSGTYAARINGLSQFAGIQQLVRVLPSTRHQASIWFWSSDSTETFRLVMRDRYENLIGWANVTNATPSTWTQVTLDFVTELADGTPVTEMVFRFAQTQDHNPSPYYLDDAALRPGAPVTTWGEIVNVLMGLKTAEFDWIDHSTVTDTLDSGGVAWPRDESVTAFFGESYGQFWDKGVDLEYEWDLVPKATPSGSLTHDLVWYGPGGLDTTPSAGIYPNVSITGGDSLTRTPAFNKVIVEGADGRYVEVEDAVSVADIGPLEKHVKDTSLHSDVSLTARANGLLSYEAANRNAVHFQMVEHKTLPRPGTHFKPGDTIPMQLPPGLAKTNKRVQSFSYTNSFPTQYLVTGSRVLSGEAAAYSLLWRLWRRFENPDRDKGGGSFSAGSGGVGAIDVAASDAPSWEKALARYICDGVDDHVEIQQALDDKFLEGGTNWSEVNLSSGRFFVDEGLISVAENIVLRGQGQMATFIRNQGVGTIHDAPSSFNGVYLVHVQQDAELTDLSFWTDLTFQGTCVVSTYGLVHDINHYGGTAQRFLYLRGTIGPTYSIRSWANYNSVPEADKRACIETDENWVELTGVYMSVNGTGLWLGDHQGGASITGMAIDKNGAEPAIFMGDAGYIAMGDVSIRDFSGDGPGIICENPTFVSLSNINIQGTTVGIAAAEGFWGPNILDISDFYVKPFVSGIDFYLDDASAFARDVSIKGFRCDGSQSGKGAGWGIRMGGAFGSGKYIISDFDIEGMDEDGILLLNGPIEAAVIHDGILTDIGKHGVVLDGTVAQVHDVFINGAGLAAANTYDAFHLKGSIEQPRIQNNKISGEAQLRYGVNISVDTVKSAIVVGNSGEDASGFGTDAINDQGRETQLTFPSDPTYGDNFFTHTPQDLIKVENETTQVSETDIHIPHLIVKVESEVANISESDLHFLA